jgi:hypothetical protein
MRRTPSRASPSSIDPGAGAGDVATIDHRYHAAVADVAPPRRGARCVSRAETFAANAFVANLEMHGKGKALFAGKARCASCRVPPLYTEPGWNLHTAAEIGIDDFQSARAPDQRYRTSPLRGLFAHAKGGFYHDGRFATLADVVEHYNVTGALGLTAGESADLAEFLESL